MKPIANSRVISVVFVGDSACGKSSMIAALSGDSMPKTHLPTYEMQLKRVSLLNPNENINIKYFVVDNPAKQYSTTLCRDAKAIYLCVDLNKSDVDITTNAQHWVDEFKKSKEISLHNVVLVGTKGDELSPEQLPLKQQLLSNLAKSLHVFSNTLVKSAYQIAASDNREKDSVYFLSVGTVDRHKRLNQRGFFVDSAVNKSDERYTFESIKRSL